MNSSEAAEKFQEIHDRMARAAGELAATMDERSELLRSIAHPGPATAFPSFSHDIPEPPASFLRLADPASPESCWIRAAKAQGLGL